MKKIIILTAGFGEGHNSAARSLKAGIDHFSQGHVQTQMVDVFEKYANASSEVWKKAYLKGIHYAPWLWNLFYQIIHRTHIIQNNPWLFKNCLQGLDQLLFDKQPDIVCSTYPIYSYLFSKMPRRSQIKPFKEVTIVTDSISINSIWYRTSPDFFIVPNEDTAKVLRGAGIPTKKVLPLGFPVQLAFSFNASHSPEDLQSPHILYVINSHKNRSAKVLRDLLAHPSWKITVVTGKNEVLKQKLMKVIEGQDHRVEFIGWTNEMPRLLMEHHFVISKAGGAMVQESIAAKCPMLITHVVPGQEEGNRLLLEKNHCGQMVHGIHQIAPTITSALENDAQTWKTWRSNLEKFNTQNSSLKIAEFLLNLQD